MIRAPIVALVLLVSLLLPSWAAAAPARYRVYVPVADVAAPTATPTATPTVAPTSTTAPSSTPTATPTARPTETRAPTATNTPRPTDTPRPAPTATPTPDLRARTTIVFLEGYGSTNVDDDVFLSLKTELVAQGWSWSQFFNFSYRGGRLDSAGQWVTSAYDCSDTQKGVGPAADTLNAMLAALSARDPDRRFVTVGHSFGGLVAWWQVYSAVEGYTPAYNVVGAVTVDAPLLGVGQVSTNLLDALNPQCVDQDGNPTTANLNGIDASKGAYASRWSRDAATAYQRGIRVRTIGNDSDSLYTFIDNTATQYIVPYDRHLSDPGRSISDSHSAVLRDYASAIGREIAYAGGLAASP